MTGLPSTAAEYHRATSYHRHRLTPHALDWDHQPAPVKRYPQLPRVPLDRDVNLPEIDYFDLVRAAGDAAGHCRTTLDRQNLARVFRLTHAATARSMHAGQAFFFRSVASAGALYPCELYLGVNRVQGLDPGLYYHDFLEASLATLRPGPVPAIPPVSGGVSATFYISGIFFRSAWKYRDRAYRYVLLDAGHLLENLRLALCALKIPFSIHLDFDDDRAALLLGLDADREACLACVHLQADICEAGQPVPAADVLPLGRDILRASKVSDGEVPYASILGLHHAGRLISGATADAFPVSDGFVQPAVWTDLDPPDQAQKADYARTLWKRRSRRNFIPAVVDRERFMDFANLMAAGMGPDTGMPPRCTASLAAGCLVGENMPVPPGLYRLDPEKKRLGRVLDGSWITPMATACLDQMWLKHAALHLLFITDLGVLDRVWGARGYRYAMIEAGRLGQQAYLAAAASGWGACGIGAVYDREAAELLRLTGDRVLLYLVGAGAVKTR